MTITGSARLRITRFGDEGSVKRNATEQQPQDPGLKAPGVPSAALQRLVGLRRGDADEAAAPATVFKLDVTGDEREERVVFALTYVFTGLVLGATLANQNRTGIDELSTEAFYAEPLTVRIAAVC
jgi:hypothetical protein